MFSQVDGTESGRRAHTCILNARYSLCRHQPPPTPHDLSRKQGSLGWNRQARTSGELHTSNRKSTAYIGERRAAESRRPCLAHPGLHLSRGTRQTSFSPSPYVCSSFPLRRSNFDMISCARESNISVHKLALHRAERYQLYWFASTCSTYLQHIAQRTTKTRPALKTLMGNWTFVLNS